MNRLLLPLLAFSLVQMSGCSADDVSCGPQNCLGCCTTDGRCIPSPDASACGNNGGLCHACPVGTTCQLGVCSAGSGQCGPTTCSGCCLGNNCVTQLSDQICGSGGTGCRDCTAQGLTCDLTRKTCGSGSCIPQCVGKCFGAADGCGGLCTVNSCVGCCDASRQCQPGASNEACGVNGADCLRCPCSSGRCTNCTPVCVGKCQGAADTCGSICPSNSCTGCCTSEASPQCLLGDTNAACGKNGNPCDTCDAGYRCDNTQSCAPDSQNPCTGLSGGTTPCTAGGLPGKCWNGACCTGCYDTPSGNCYALPWDFYCGKDGSVCTNCDLAGQICEEGSCVDDADDQIGVTIASARLVEGAPGWDTDGTEPDLELRVWWNNSSCAFADLSSSDGCAPKVSDTTFPIWAHSFGTRPTGSLLAAPFCVVLVDQDGAACTSGDTDFIGSCQVTVTTSALNAGYLTVGGCALPSASNYVDFLHFTFQIP